MRRLALHRITRCSVSKQGRGGARGQKGGGRGSGKGGGKGGQQPQKVQKVPVNEKGYKVRKKGEWFG